MNKMFTQPTGPVAKQVNKQTIARMYGCRVKDVAYLNTGAPMAGYLYLYAQEENLVFTSNTNVSGTLVAYTVTDLVCTLVTSDGTFSLLSAPNFNKQVDFLTFDMFGLNNTGTVDVTSRVASIFAIANKFGLEVKQKKGKYLLSGDFKIPVKYGFDFEGAEFIPASNTTGGFAVSQPQEPTTYASDSAIVAGINATASVDLVAGNSILTSQASSAVLNNNFLFMTGADDLFQYTGNSEPTKWKHASVLHHYGLLAVPFKYGVSAITSLYALPIAEKVTVCKLPTINLINNPKTILFAFDGISRYQIFEGSVKNKPLKQQGSFYLCTLTNYAYVDLYGLYDPYPTVSFSDSAMTVQTSSYTLNYGKGTDLNVYNSRCQGYGWGSTGGGDIIANTAFIGCDFSRYDSHNPTLGYFKTLDCFHGIAGIALCGWGTVFMDRPRWNMNKRTNDPYGNKPILIRLRESSGGFYDGDIYIRDAVIDGWGDDLLNFIEAPQNLDTALPAGSPIEPYAFKHVYVDGLTFTKPTVGKKLAAFHSLTGSLSSPLHAPQSIEIKRLDYNCYGSENPEDDALVFDFTNAKQQSFNTAANHPAIEPASTRIVMEDCKVQAVVLKRNAVASSHCVDFIGNRITPANNSEKFAQIFTNVKGTYSFKDCKLSRFSDNVAGSAITYPLVVQVQGGSFKQAVAANLPINITETLAHDISFDGVTCIGDFSATSATLTNRNIGQWVGLNNCNYYNLTGSIVPHLMQWSGTIGTTETVIGLPIHDGNNIITALNYNSVVTYDAFKLPNVSGVLARYLYNPNLAGYYLNLTRNGHRVNVVSGYGSASIRELHVK